MKLRSRWAGLIAAFTGTISINQLSGFCSDPNGAVPFTSIGTLTASDGSTFTAFSSGTVCNLTPTTNLAISTYTITGGTGRFATATGTGTIISHGDFSNGFPIQNTYTEDGTISFNN